MTKKILLLALFFLIAPVLAVSWLDTDNDGLQDKYEQTYRTDPKKPDTDGGGVSDGAEILLDGTNPLDKSDDINLDDDSDTLSNSEEIILDSNPSLADSDNDGLSDYEELIYKTNALLKDTDFDGLSDFREVKEFNTNPVEFDTDADGVSDGTEILVDKTDAKNPQNNLKKDSDSDGLTDSEEARIGTEISQMDTDGDGYKDGQEVKAGYSPLGSGKLGGDIKAASIDPRISGVTKDGLYQITSSRAVGQSLNLSGLGPKTVELVLFVYDSQGQNKKQLVITDQTGFWQFELSNLMPDSYQIYLTLIGNNKQVFVKSLKTEVNLSQPGGVGQADTQNTSSQADALAPKRESDFYLVIGLGLLVVTALAAGIFYFLKRRRDLKPSLAAFGEDNLDKLSPQIVKRGSVVKPLLESSGFVKKEPTFFSPPETPTDVDQTWPATSALSAKPTTTQDVKTTVPGNLPLADLTNDVSDLKARIK